MLVNIQDSRNETDSMDTNLGIPISHPSLQSGITPVKMGDDDYGILKEMLDSKNVIQL